MPRKARKQLVALEVDEDYEQWARDEACRRLAQSLRREWCAMHNDEPILHGDLPCGDGVPLGVVKNS